MLPWQGWGVPRAMILPPRIVRQALYFLFLPPHSRRSLVESTGIRSAGFFFFDSSTYSFLFGAAISLALQGRLVFPLFVFSVCYSFPRRIRRPPRWFNVPLPGDGPS